MKLYLFILFMLCSCRQTDSPIDSIQLATKKPIADSQIIASLEDTININQYWLDQKITKATLYCYLPEAINHSQNLILDENYKLHTTVIDSLTFELDSSSLNYFKRKLLKQTNFMEEWVAGCFEPHHGLVLKNDKNEIVGHISFCFECNQYKLNPEHVNYIPMDVFRTLCKKAKIPIKRGEIMNLYHKSRNTHI